MKSRSIFLKGLLFILLSALGSAHSWGGQSTYYGRGTATVSSASPTGSGTVYVSTSNNSQGTYSNSSSATGSAQGSENSSATVTLYAFAKANNNYDFVGWNTANGTSNTTSTSHPYTFSINATSTNENNPTKSTIYAIFAEKPLFYFRSIAVVTPQGAGTASVSPTTTSARGEHWNSTSATTTNISFSVTPGSNYGFLGWSETENGTIVSTNNPYNPTLTSTSKNSGSPTTTTLYARFQPYATSITASPSELTVYVGIPSSPITHTVSPSDAYDEHTTYESSNTTIATVDTDGRVTGVATGTTTITIKSLKSDNSTVAASTTVSVTVKNKVATPVISFEVGENGTLATITCATSGSKIYYTKNGDTPTATSTDEYSSPIPVVEGDVIKAIAVKDPADNNWDNSDLATEIYSLCTTDAPVITINGNSSTGKATVTITANTGETIYYKSGTSTPNDPTPSNYDGTGTTTVTINNVAFGTIIKAIAKSSSCQASATVMKEISGYSYVADDQVVLDDREDHTWSYYQSSDNLPTGYPDNLYSSDPRNVKIIYQGNGQTIGETEVTGVKVSIAANETQNTFVYYKTLEKGTDGKYAYTTITNPFSVRPKIGSTYYGFDGWEIISISDGSSIDGYGTGNTIPANTEIKIIPSGSYTTNCLSTTVVLRAKWAVAEVSTNGSFNNDYGVERMFYVIRDNSNSTAVTANGKAITYTTIYPNGTTDGGTTEASTSDIKYRPFGSNNAISLSKDSRIENFIIYNGGSLVMNANNNNLTIGRNVSGYNNGNAAATVKGHNTNGTDNSPFSTNLNYTLRLESGTYGNFYLIDVFSDIVYYNCRIMVKAVLGSDYDRAKNDNTKLHVAPSGTITSAERIYQKSNANKDQLVFDWNIKSGKMQENLLNNAGSDYAIYLGAGTSLRYVGKKRLLVEGGEMASIAGGIDSYNISNNSMTYTTNDDYVTASLTDQVYIRIINNANTKVRGAIYGAAAYAGSRGGRTFVITGGTINGWIAGGCNGTQSSGGQLYGTTYMYLGGNAKVEHAVDDPYIGGYNLTHTEGSGRNQQTIQDGDNGAYGGYIFGAGCGIKPYGYNANNPGNTLNNATVGKVYGSNIALADNLSVSRDVYGGGNFGQVADNSNTTNGGNWSTNNDMTSDIYILGGVIHGNVYGGSNNQKGQTVNITMTGGKVEAGVYGGSNSWGTINNNVAISISGGTVETGVFGGGYGTSSNSCDVSGTVDITMAGGTVLNGLYGGGNVNSKIGGKTTIKINGGTIGSSATNANVYGGGLGELTRAKDDVEINIGTATTSGNTTNYTGNAVIYGDVYGGSAKGVTNCNDGGTAVTSGAQTDVTLNSGTINGSLYGGGHGIGGASANVWGPVTVTVNKGKVTGEVFGCNNENGTPKSTVEVTINGTDAVTTGYALAEVYGGGNKADYSPGTGVTGYPKVEVTGCNNSIGFVYGGGNAADVPSSDVTVWGGTIGKVFGGGHGNKNASPQTEANVDGDVAVKIYGGTIDQVFGGSNSKGTISGDVTVNINKSNNTGSCEMMIGEVYGGGNEAAGNAGSITIGYTGNWTTNHDNANDTDNRIGYELEGIGTVYGGANAADIGTSENNSNITLNINNGIVNNVFGGNNSTGNIYGTITVNINRTSNVNNQWYVGNVFGGGNLAAYTAPNTTPNYPAVNIQNGTVSGSVFGGGYGASAVVTANPHVTVSGGTISGDVFGGGEEAGVTGNPTVLMTGGQVTNVYGGGMQANVDGDNTVSIEGGSVTYDVYGGGMQGDVTGNVTVNISKSGTPTGTPSIGRDVYGGGALANTNTANRSLNAQNEEVIDLSNTSKKTIVNLYPGATIGHDVYGGGRGQKADNATQTNAVEAVVYGNVTVYQMGAILTAAYSDEGLATRGRIFGGNNINGSPKGHVKVHVSKTTGTTGQQRSSNEARASATATHTYELAAVYGGGNQAEYNPYSSTDFAEVEIDGCNDVSIHSVYGGGNAASTPATLVTIGGAYEIEYVFGGGNGAGRNNPGANVGYHDYGDDHAGISQEDVNYRLNSDYKYGTGVAKTNIYGGRIHNIYGGSNTRGNVRETAVAMLDEVNTCPLVVDGIYGGGREAYMEGGTSIELGCITGLDEIYGGSEKADVGSSVALTITSGHFGRVFGGNNKSGKIFGSITVNIEQTGCVPITIDELYLGGNNAPYSIYGYEDTYTEHTVGGETVKHYDLKLSGDNPYNNPVLNIRSFESIGTVYGGGKGEYATIVGDPTVDINVTKGWVNGEYVGTVDKYSAYNNGTPAELAKDGEIGTVFGGGNAAEVIGSPQVKIGDRMGSTVELSSMSLLYESIDDEPYIEHGDIRVTKDGTTGVTYTNKTDGTKTLTEAISQTVNGATITDNVYGGGNAADVTGNTEIQIGPAQTSGGGQPSPAPQRTEQPAAQTDQPAAPAQTQPASQTQNAATEAPQGRAVTPTRQ